MSLGFAIDLNKISVVVPDEAFVEED